MKTVGKQLQDARAAKGWSPEMAARETKIKIDRVLDLESDDFSNFSSPTYARGFVRTYARALGIDEYRILRQLDNKLPEDDNATFVNDTGVPYMPEQSQVSKPFEVGKGVYIAGGVGLMTLLLIGFILIQSYRAGYFASSTPTSAATPSTNVAAAIPDTGPARAMPADSNAAPVALPVDTSQPIATTSATPIDTNAAPRAMPVDPTALASSSNAPDSIPVAPVAPADSTAANATPAPVAVAAPVEAAPPVAAPATPVPAPVPAAPAPAVATPAIQPSTTSIAPASTPASSTSTPASTPAPAATPAPEAPTVATTVPTPGDATTPAPTVPTTTATPPRAQAVDLNAINAAPMTNAAPVADAAPATEVHHTVHSLSARDSNAHSSVTTHHDIYPSQGTAAGPIIYSAATPVSTVTGLPANATPQLASAQPAPFDLPPVVDAPSSLGPANATSAETGASGDSGTPAPDSAAALTGASDSSPAAPSGNSGAKFHGKRLVLTASHDSFIRVTALDGPHAGQSLYSSILHSGQSISFNGHKYSINVGDPSAVDIALDGINYGPHSDNSAPDTFTVESHIP